MKKTILILAAFFLMLFGTANASLVEFSPTGDIAGGAGLIENILAFDWASNGSLVIEQDLVDSEKGATTLDDFFNPLNFVANVGSWLDMNIHAHARLVAYDLGLSSTTPGDLSTNGATGAYEVTAALDGVERGVLQADGSLKFTSIVGSYSFYLDRAPNSNVATGAGFNDGAVSPGITNPFLSGQVSLRDGNYDASKGTGDTFLTNTVDFYDDTVIRPDPYSPGVILVGTTFDTSIKVTGGGTLLKRDGTANVGQGTYLVQSDDLVLNADAYSTFTAVPEPASVFLLGLGLFGAAIVGRKKMQKS